MKSQNYSKNRGRSKKPQTRKEGYNKQDEFKESEDRTEKGRSKDSYTFGNDPHWYAKYPFLLQDTARPPFNLPLGFDLHMGTKMAEASVDNTVRYQIPSIMVINYVPFAGGTGYSTVSPANAVALKLWTSIRRSMSGSTRPYDAPDVFMYVMAMSQINAWFYNMRRAYGLMSIYSTLNRSYPKAIVEACGFDYDDMKYHLSDLRAHINSYSAMLQAFGVPKGMDFISRQAGLVSRIFTDDTAAKFQVYVFRPELAWKYDETSNPNGTCCTKVLLDHRITDATAQPHSLMTFKDIMTITETLVRAVITSEDCGTMNADLLRAYGELYTIPGIAEDYTTELMHDPMMLMQIHNATFMGEFDGSINTGEDEKDILIFQDANGNILNRYQFVGPGAANAPGACMDRLISMPIDQPDPLSIMEATRLMSIATYEMNDREGTTCKRNVSVGGAEICTTWKIAHIDPLTGHCVYSVPSGISGYDSFVDFNPDNNYSGTKEFQQAMFVDLSEFNQHPLIYMIKPKAFDDAFFIATSYEMRGVLGNTQNWSTIDYDQLYSMHYTAINSLLDNSSIDTGR